MGGVVVPAVSAGSLPGGGVRATAVVSSAAVPGGGVRTFSVITVSGDAGVSVLLSSIAHETRPSEENHSEEGNLPLSSTHGCKAVL